MQEAGRTGCLAGRRDRPRGANHRANVLLDSTGAEPGVGRVLDLDDHRAGSSFPFLLHPVGLLYREPGVLEPLEIGGFLASLAHGASPRPSPRCRGKLRSTTLKVPFLIPLLDDPPRRPGHPEPAQRLCHLLTSINLGGPGIAGADVALEQGDDRGADRLALLAVLLLEHRLVGAAGEYRQGQLGVEARSSPRLWSRTSTKNLELFGPRG